MQKYFEKKSWYNPKFDVSEFDYTKLNTYEAANLALLIDFEGMKDEVYGANIDESIKSGNNHTEDISGNLIPDSNSRYLSDDEISKLTKDEKLMVACEILARYGVDFTNMENGEKAQEYFEKQSWYTPSIDITEFDFTKLNMYEAVNIKLLLDAEEDPELVESSDGNLANAKADGYYEEELGLYQGMYLYVVDCQQSITLREEPSTSAKEIVQIPLYSAVTYLEMAPNGFYYVSYNGLTGYALASYLDTYEPQIATGIICKVVNCNEYITLRTSPSTNADAILTIPLGATVDYIEAAVNDFYMISYNGQNGYALARYLEFQ